MPRGKKTTGPKGPQLVPPKKKTKDLELKEPLWDRQPKEPMAAFQSFRRYLDLGSIRKVYQAEKQEGVNGASLRHRQGLSAKWLWVQRREAYLAHHVALEEEERERATIERGRSWAKRRDDFHGNLMGTAEALLAKAGDMLSVPHVQRTLVREEKDKDGNVIAAHYVVEPMKWTAGNIAQLVAAAERVAGVVLQAKGGDIAAAHAPEDDSQLLEEIVAELELFDEEETA